MHASAAVLPSTVALLGDLFDNRVEKFAIDRRALLIR
jgi:hypothetical protein